MDWGGTVFMRYFLGIDGGGTKTEALICNEYGVVLGKGTAGPSNPIFIGKPSAFENIGKSIKQALTGFGEVSLDSAAVCIPGIKRYGDEIKAQLLNGCKNSYINGDELNAFYGALAKPYGVVVVSGTGSFAMGVNKKGESAEAGGWGPLVGDEGSGYSIGIACLKAVIREYECAGDKTLLTVKVMNLLGLHAIPDIRRVIHTEGFDRKTISDLSRVVYESALEGDAVSVEIIREAAGHLADLAANIVKRLEMHDSEYEAVLSGGISKFGNLVSTPFEKYIKERYENINVVKPEFTPAVGSLIIALKGAGLDAFHHERLKNLKESEEVFQ